ncbi:MAG: hydrogenase expression protein HypE [Thermoleophilia bacterium]
MASREVKGADPRRGDGSEIHVLWMTAGLGCDGESVAMTAATAPSLEDLLSGVIPGSPRMILHNAVLAFENGDDFMQAWYDAENDVLDPFVLVVEGAVGDERRSGDGHWSGFGVDPIDGQPITVNEWIDRLAPKAAAIVAVGTCATYGGIPAMKNNPTGAMGVPDFLGWSWRSRLGLPIICIPGCPTQPDNMTSILLELLLFVGGLGPAPELDDRLRPVSLYARTTRESCSRAGFTEQGQFATTYGNDSRCLVKLGCKGPAALCNVPQRGWVNGVGGCPNVGGICIGCTMPGFPDKFTPFMGPDPWGNAAANFQRFTYGPLFRHFRKRNLALKYEQEPAWRGQPAPSGDAPDGGREGRRP